MLHMLFQEVSILGGLLNNLPIKTELTVIRPIEQHSWIEESF